MEKRGRDFLGPGWCDGVEGSPCEDRRCEGLCGCRAVFGDGSVTSMHKAVLSKTSLESLCFFLPEPPFLRAGLLELFGIFPSVLCVVGQSFIQACLRRQNWKMHVLRDSTYRFVLDNPDFFQLSWERKANRAGFNYSSVTRKYCINLGPAGTVLEY